MVAIMTVSFFSACGSDGSEPQPSPLIESEIRAFADPMAENILQAINNDSYEQYTRDLSARFKGNLSEEYFKTLNSNRTSSEGQYVSKTYWQMSVKDNRIAVFYKTRFNLDPSVVVVTVYFKKFFDKEYIDGLFMDSPQTRANNC